MKASLPIWLMMMLIDVSLSANQQIEDDRRKREPKVLSRRKRYIIFPVGSSFSVATCMVGSIHMFICRNYYSFLFPLQTIGVYGNPNFSLFSWALNYGFAYNLPDNSSYFTQPSSVDIFSVPSFIDGFAPPPDAEPPAPPDTTTTTTAKPEIFIPDHSHDHDYHDHDHASAPSASGDDMTASRRKYHVYYQPKYETKPMIQRRYRRDVYRNIEGVIDK